MERDFSCDCGTDRASMATSRPVSRDLSVEILYIDIDTCDRCQGADAILKRAIATVRQPLAAMGVAIDLTETLVETAEQATALRFHSSPSIRIDGRDIQSDPRESECEACSALPNQSKVECRTWTYQGKSFTTPPEELLVRALLLAALAPIGDPPKVEAPFVLPDNLRTFFQNKDVRSRGCGCS